MADGCRTPRFSILTAAYNAEDTVGEAIESVLAQTVGDWELVIVDDGSTDGTWEVIEGYAARDSRVKTIRQANTGTGLARNKAAANSVAPMLVLLDADDMMLPGYLESQTLFIETHPDYAIYSCNADMLADGDRHRVWRGLGFRFVRRFSLRRMLYRNMVFGMAVLDRGAFEGVGGFHSMSRVEDYDLWLRLMIRGGRHIYNPAVLGLWRMTPNSKSTHVVCTIQGVIEIMERLASECSDDRCAGLCSRAKQVWRTRLALAELDEDLVRGEREGARRRFFSHWIQARLTIPRATLGAVLMLVDPALYQRVFLWRAETCRE